MPPHWPLLPQSRRCSAAALPRQTLPAAFAPPFPHRTPPQACCQVQAALALPENRPALDVNAACSGFLYGTAVARGLLATLGGRYALVIGTEALSRLMDPPTAPPVCCSAMVPVRQCLN